MKNLIKSAIPICLLLLLYLPLQAQNNQATIYELRDDNISAVASAVIAHIASPGYPTPIIPPNLADVIQFLSTPFNNQIYLYDASGCPTPGLRVFARGSDWSFRFDNLTGTTGNLLFIGSMNYGGSSPQSFFSVNGPEVYNGVDYPNGSIQYHIFLTGTFCSSCASPAAAQCYGKMEVVIVDKNIL